MPTWLTQLTFCSANDRAILANKKTIQPNDVLEALPELEFESFLPRCVGELNGTFSTDRCCIASPALGANSSILREAVEAEWDTLPDQVLMMRKRTIGVLPRPSSAAEVQR